jgi:hypothetical protein
MTKPVYTVSTEIAKSIEEIHGFDPLVEIKKMLDKEHGVDGYELIQENA